MLTSQNLATALAATSEKIDGLEAQLAHVTALGTLAAAERDEARNERDAARAELKLKTATKRTPAKRS